MYFIDSHAHLDDFHYKSDLDEVIIKAKTNKVEYILSIGQNLKSSKETLEISHKYSNVFAVLGFHPHEAVHFNADFYNQFQELINDPKVVAIGEIGLDYHYAHSPVNIQKEVFHKMMSLAKVTKKPVVIHSREAEVDTLSVLRENQDEVIGVMHCFSGSPKTLYQALDLGYYISIAGLVTFNKAKEIQDLITEIPNDRLLIETDCPYLTPVPYRGKRNEPSYLIYTAKKIAELKNISMDRLAEITTQNVINLFKLSIS